MNWKRPFTMLRVVCGVALISTLSSSAALAVDVAKWSVCDIPLAAGGASTNWYTDPNAQVTATLTGPGGISKKVTGFWNGGNIFEIRFTPTVEGTWKYVTSSLNPGLNNKTGTIEVGAPSVGNHGFVRVDRNHPNSFIYDDGTRHFMWGQTYYSLMYDAMQNDNWKEAVDQSLSHGMNKVRMFVYAQGGFVGRDKIVSHGYPDATPYAGPADSPNRDNLNLAYWEKLDEVVQYMQRKGMVADLIVTNFYPNGHMAGTDAQNDRFVRYVASRYAAYANVIWTLANEWERGNTGHYPQDQADFDRIGGIIRGSDPWMIQGSSLRPLSIHNQSKNFQFFGAAWPTYAALQYGCPWNGTPKHGDEGGNSNSGKS